MKANTIDLLKVSCFLGADGHIEQDRCSSPSTQASTDIRPEIGSCSNLIHLLEEVVRSNLVQNGRNNSADVVTGL